MSSPVDPDSNQVRKMANLLIFLAGIGFIVSSWVLGSQYLSVNRNGFESRFFPPTVDWTFREWRQEPNGHWSAEVYFFKLRPECIYISDQIVTATFYTPHGEIGETGIAYVGDETPGNNRPDGWQRLDDRVEFLHPEITPGTVMRGNVIHQCHEGAPTVSGFRDVVVGQDMPWPPYVQEWIDNGRTGLPRDYR